MPAVALGAALLLDLPPMTAKVAVAAAALPSGVNSYLLAVQFGTGQALASNQMTIATACAVVHHGVLADRRARRLRLGWIGSDHAVSANKD